MNNFKEFEVIVIEDYKLPLDFDYVNLKGYRFLVKGTVFDDKNGSRYIGEITVGDENMRKIKRWYCDNYYVCVNSDGLYYADNDGGLLKTELVNEFKLKMTNCIVLRKDMVKKVELLEKKEGNMSECPYIKEANWMCSALAREIKKSETWKDKQDIITAIISIRQEERAMVSEWEHLHSDDAKSNDTVEYRSTH